MPHRVTDDDRGTLLEDTVMVPDVDQTLDTATHNHKSDRKNSNSGTRSTKGTPAAPKTLLDGRCYILKSLKNKGFSESVASTMCDARAQTTYKQYGTYITRWELYCRKRKISPRHPNVKQVLDYLDSFKNQLGFSSISTAKAALNSFISINGKPLGQNRYVNQYMAGLAKSLPRTPRYQEIWDPQTVLEFLKKWSPAKFLNLFQLTIKTAILILLVTAQRPQILGKLSLDFMKHRKRTFIFTVVDNLKHQRGYAPATIIELKAFPADLRLCVENYLKAYINRTKHLRQVQDLFVTTTKPHGKASMATISRWVKTGLQLSGVNTKTFGAGSTRAAVANKAYDHGVPVDTILKKACWAQESTFTRWYKKAVKIKEPDFQTVILSRN
mgnify:CR=1 FL=1